MFERQAVAVPCARLGWGSTVARRLQPYQANLRKRQVRSPKFHGCDSELSHLLLGLREVNDLLGHPAFGALRERFVVERLFGQLGGHSSASCYRTVAGAELDVVVETDRKKLGFEIKFSSAPKATKGFWSACADVGAARAYVVAPVRQGWPVAEGVDVISPVNLAAVLANT